MELVDVNQSGLQLLSSTNLGRVAVNGDASPEIYPVRYAIDGSNVVFRANRSLQQALQPRSMVTFQADGYDDNRSQAWSIVLRGPVEEMRDLGRVEIPIGFTSEETEPWIGEGDAYWVRIIPNTLDISGNAGGVVDIT